MSREIDFFSFFAQSVCLIQFKFHCLTMSWYLSWLLNTVSNTPMYWLLQSCGSEWDLIANCLQINCKIDFSDKRINHLNLWIYKSMVMKKQHALYGSKQGLWKMSEESLFYFHAQKCASLLHPIKRARDQFTLIAHNGFNLLH